jgi:hypothetical protein
MSGSRIALLIIGVLLALVGFGSAVGGAGMLWADSTQRGPDGYLESPTWSLETGDHAVTTEHIDLGAPTRDDWLWFRDFDIRIDVAPLNEEAVFVGIAPREDVEAYLDGVGYSEIARLGGLRDTVRYRTTAGGATPAPPVDQTFWAAQAAGEGPLQLEWRAQPGSWVVVVMNADGQSGIDVLAGAAARADFLLGLGVVLLVGGLLFLVGGTALIVGAAAGQRRDEDAASAPASSPSSAPGPASAAGSSSAAVGRAPAPYPVTIEGRLDEPLSRWLWLVKWVLLIPHGIVLAFLWLAFALLTVVAGFAILFTGRYPRALFDFNVGVIRWTWRVVYYGYGALGTDRYPPFTLAAADHPATLDVAYPEHLSRGLVLVKWWLLAIPHYLIVGLLVGGGATWATTDEAWGTWALGGGSGIIGVLVFVAGLMLLVRARYPGGLFDIVMGCNRWVYRVLAYAALMTDEYPPFRLDTGGAEPQPVQDPPPSPPPADDHAELVHR